MSDASKWLDYAGRGLSIVPDIPGTKVDDAVIGTAQAIIALAAAALRSTTPDEVLQELRKLADRQAARVDVDSIASTVIDAIDDDRAG